METHQQLDSTFASFALSVTFLTISMVAACSGNGSSIARPGTGGAPSSTGGTPSGTGGNLPALIDAGAIGGMQSATTAATGGVVDTGAGFGPGDGASLVDVSGYDVMVDPYGHNPLAAVVNLHGIVETQVQEVKVVVKGQGGARDFEKIYSPGQTDLHRFDTSDLTFPEAGYKVPMVGLYADQVNEVHILVSLLDQGYADITLSIETHLTNPGDAVWAPSIQVNTAIPDLMEPGWTVAEISLESDPTYWTRPIAFDEQGAIRWVLRLDLPWRETNALCRSLDGNFLTGSVDTIVEVNELGRILREIQLPGYWLHHELLQILSGHAGNILVAASKEDASTIEDRVLEVSNTSGDIVQEWDMANVLDPTRTVFVDTQGMSALPGDWIHVNGLAYSDADDSLIISGRHQGVAKVDRAGDLVWVLAPNRGWKTPQSDKLLTAVDAAGVSYPASVQNGRAAATDGSFDWPFGQHSPVLLPNHDLLLFDNGANRHFAGGCSFSRAVIYRIDEAALTVRQMGQFVLDSSKSSCFVSNTYQLPVTGNFLIQPGSLQLSSTLRSSIVTEVTTMVAGDGTVTFGNVVFDATLNMSAYSYRGHRWKF